MKTSFVRIATLSIGVLALSSIAPQAFADSVVKVTLDDTTGDINPDLKLGMGMSGDMAKSTMSLKAQPASVPAGVVTFQVLNASKGTVHEMILAAVADTSKQMPYVANESRVDEDKAGDLGEVSELDPGKSGELKVTLKPGTYLLYCNVPGHYMSGMWTTITAK